MTGIFRMGECDSFDLSIVSSCVQPSSVLVGNVEHWRVIELDANPDVFYPVLERDRFDSEMRNGASEAALQWFVERIDAWKRNSGSNRAGEYEFVVEEKLELTGSSRLEGDGKEVSKLLDGEVEGLVRRWLRLSDKYIQSFLDCPVELYRGLNYNVPELLLNVLENISQDKLKYKVDTTAVVNFTLDKKTAISYGALHTSQTFNEDEIVVALDGIYYDEDDPVADGEIQVAGTAFDTVEIDELLTPETGSPLTEPLEKLRGSASADDVQLNYGEHRLVGKIIVILASEGLSLEAEPGVRLLESWIDTLATLSDESVNSLIDPVLLTEGLDWELDTSFAAALFELTKGEVDADFGKDPASVFQ